MEEFIKILVVDDDAVDRMAVKRSLLLAGVQIQVAEASSCSDAIRQLQQQQFDCVFLDYLLPDGDGLKLVQEVSNLALSVPMIVLTGQGDEEIAVQLMKAGASDYLAKSKVSADNLALILRQAIRIHKAEKSALEANQKLQESEERYRLVLEGSNDGIWDWHCLTDEVYCNDRLLEIIGTSRSEFSLTPQAFTQIMHPEDLPNIRAVVRAHLNNGEKCEVEFRLRHQSGEYRYCFARGKVQHDQFGCPLRMSGVLSDITERKHLEQALRESESRFRRLAESNVIGIIIVDLQGNILEANEAFLQTVGYSRRDLMAGRLNWSEMTPVEYAHVNQEALAQVRRTGVFNASEKEYFRSDGSRIPVLQGGALLAGAENKIICFAIDLSERKIAEAEIMKLNRDLTRRIAELETLLDVIPIGIAIAQEPGCQSVRVNPALAQMLALPPNANASKSAPLPEQPDYKVFFNGKEVPANELPLQYAAQQGVEVLNKEYDVLITNSSSVKLLASAAPLFDEHHRPRGSIAAFVDITERQRIEEQERLLASASALLATSFDSQTALENLARLIVPQLADWCTIHVQEENRSLRLVTVSHTEEAKAEWGFGLLQRYPYQLDAPYGTPHVIRTGQSEFYPEIPDTVLETMAREDEHRRLMHELDLKSLMCVPMKARGRTLGAISLMFNGSGRIYNSADLALAEDVARRAGLAVDNARLYQEATQIGDNLRRAILILGEQQQQLRVLQRLTNLLNQRLTDLPGLLQVMVRAVCDAIDGAEFSLIVLHNPSNNLLELTATAGKGAENLRLNELTATESGLLSQVFATGEGQLFLKNEECKVATIYAVAIESAQAGRLGVLAIGNWQDMNAFDLEDQNLLDAVGEQAAIAINNAKMISALEEREERLGVQNEILGQQNRELQLNRQQIQLQNLQLLEAARLKSDFLATMSHELRTPLNAIIGFSQVLLRQRTATLAENQVEMVERILNSGNNLLVLIKDILDLAKIEAGRLNLELEEFNLNQLVTATVAEYKQMAVEKQLELQLVEELANPLVINDNVRLKQVLVNLLSNAIKFTETGSITVKVWELSADRIALEVKDTGIGISESDIEHIFDQFRQIDQGITRKHGGTGLGLTITRSLVIMMQGSIRVDSKPGVGSTLHIELPRQVKDEGQVQKRRTQPSNRLIF